MSTYVSWTDILRLMILGHPRSQIIYRYRRCQEMEPDLHPCGGHGGGVFLAVSLRFKPVGTPHYFLQQPGREIILEAGQIPSPSSQLVVKQPRISATNQPPLSYSRASSWPHPYLLSATSATSTYRHEIYFGRFTSSRRIRSCKVNVKQDRAPAISKRSDLCRSVLPRPKDR